jgi:hypothetical protein
VSRGFRKEYIPGWQQNFANLYQEYKVLMNQNHAHSTKRALRQKRRESTIDPNFSADFSIEE